MGGINKMNSWKIEICDSSKDLDRRIAMKPEKRSEKFLLWILVTMLVMMACSLSSNVGSAPAGSPTPTPTVIAGQVEPPPPNTSRCDGLSGTFEVQLLVGPADAVGLEPFAVGEIPFSVEAAGESYALQGANKFFYQDVLTEEWGTYTVTFYMDASVNGDCSGSEGAEQLNVLVEMTGEQLVEVRADGFSGDYPWSGTHSQDLSFPLQEGASAEGEGWALVLHINP
jgi:hypothetical protein